MTIRVCSSVVIVLLTLSSVALAQTPAPAPSPAVEAPAVSPPAQTGVQVEQKRTRYVVLPRPSVETAIKDSEAAAEHVGQSSRRDEIIRESRERPILRPDLDYTIANGIQSRNVLRALGR
jgi:hypothetical protein